MREQLRHFAAEFVGIFALVFIGGGAIMMAASANNPAGLLSIALAHGLALALMVSATMGVSGGHLNPAVTIGFLVARRISLVMAGVHVAAQLLGAVFGALALKWTMPAALFTATRAGGQMVSLEIATTQAIGLEAIAAFFLMFVIYGTAVNDVAPKLGGMAIGLTIAADILAIGPLTGASMNPGRSFGPALVSGIWEGHLVYWVGPVLGAVVAALLWEFVLLQRRRA
jgi:MIP family channel proteins